MKNSHWNKYDTFYQDKLYPSLTVGFRLFTVILFGDHLLQNEETVLTSPVCLSVHRGSFPSYAGSREHCRGRPAAADTG